MNISVTLPEKVSTNKGYAGQHWSVRKRHADEFHLAVRCAVGRKNWKFEYPVEIWFHYTFKGRRLDISNCSFMTKLLEDGLVKAGVLKDDSAKYVEAHHITQELGKEDRCEIEINPDAK